MRKLNYLLLFTTVLLTTNCGSKKTTNSQYGVKSTLPLSKESLNPPNGVISGWGQRESSKEYSAIERATNAATVDLTKFFDQLVKSAWEEYTEDREINGKQKFTSRGLTLIEGVVDRAVRGVRTHKRESYYNEEKDIYTAFVVVHLEYEKALEDLKKAMRNDEILKQDFVFKQYKERATENFEQMKSRRNY